MKKIVFILTLILNFTTSTFKWFFIGDLLFKVSPVHAMIIFGLLLTEFVSKQVILNMGVKK